MRGGQFQPTSYLHLLQAGLQMPYPRGQRTCEIDLMRYPKTRRCFIKISYFSGK